MTGVIRYLGKYKLKGILNSQLSSSIHMQKP
nr:MAG TPA: hypothetical protein [Caudoviricetes sp.]